MGEQLLADITMDQARYVVFWLLLLQLMNPGKASEWLAANKLSGSDKGFRVFFALIYLALVIVALVLLYP